MKQIGDMTHRELCLLAAKKIRTAIDWDVPKCPYSIVEPFSFCSYEQPDVFAWCYWTTVMIECKVSHADFLADLKKPFRLKPESGIGRHRYYCCPEGIIKAEEVPEGFGLLYAIDGRLKLIKKAVPFDRHNQNGEIGIVTSIVKRNGIKPQVFNFRKNEPHSVNGR